MSLTRDSYGRVFDFETVPGVMEDLKKVHIDRYTVSSESVREIKRLLDLDNKNTEEELRGIRNAVVFLFDQERKEDCMVDENGKDLPDSDIDFNRYMWWSTQISGITAVIDQELWNKGFPV